MDGTFTVLTRTKTAVGVPSMSWKSIIFLFFRQWVLATFKLWNGELDFIDRLLEDDIRLVSIPLVTLTPRYKLPVPTSAVDPH